RRRARAEIQMVFQDPYASLNPRWRVGDIVAEPARTLGHRLDGGPGALLEQVGLSARDVEKFPHEFSGGQRQRICVARALSSKPKFIVCDEPTSALDVSVQAQVLNLMRDLQSDLGLTYLFISHDLSVVRYMADRIGVLYLGALMEEAPRDTLFATPRHPYTRMLLDAAPRLDAFGREVPPPKGEIPDPINPPKGCPFNPRCPLAVDRCREERPVMRMAGSTRVACHAVEEGRS
ncbi:MAG: oligopeptide/dipeptide ABC transporter ATP-binding protein, partial [Pseudomonadota bacterium]